MKSDSVLKPQRRALLLSTLFGGSWLGLRSLATGLPASFLLAPHSARAEEPGACPAGKKPQYLILSTSAAGDPITNNCPGTYEDPGIAHPADASMAASALSLGGVATKAAKPWSTLPQRVLDRASFFHHRSLTNNHADYPKVMRLMGATEKGEMLPSLFAKYLGPCLKTVQNEPISVSLEGGETLSYSGRVLPALPPLGLKNILAAPTGPLSQLRKLRDQTLDEMNSVLQDGASPAAKQFLDRYAASQAQARSISESLLENLADISGNSPQDQAIAAATLVKMQVSPVVTCHIPFGGDNHSDAGLSAETQETVSGMKTLALLFQKLDQLGLSDSTTVGVLNVFGRPLRDKAPAGRDHWQLHNVMCMFGANVRGSVVGGLRPTDDGRDFQSLPVASKTGKGALDADIPVEETLAAAGKTLGAALGIERTQLDTAITQGAVVEAALA
jgi:Protein of unknown function (DUF1501)